MGNKRRLRDPRVNFRALAEYIRGVYAIMGAISDPPMHVIVFYTVASAPGEHTVGDIASSCGLNLKSASRVLQTLRKINYIELRGDPQDTRKRRVHLAAKGENVAKLINAAAVDTAFRIVENVMGFHPSNPNVSLRSRKSHRKR